MIADIDHFKRINDTWGHDAGDEVLRAFSARLAKGLRALDLAARYGGEEFVVVMPGAGLAEAEIAAERFRMAIQNAPFTLPTGESIEVTVSVGLAQVKAGESVDTFLRRADKALYAAKSHGRNRVQAAAGAAA